MPISFARTAGLAIALLVGAAASAENSSKSDTALTIDVVRREILDALKARTVTGIAMKDYTKKAMAAVSRGDADLAEAYIAEGKLKSDQFKEISDRVAALGRCEKRRDVLLKSGKKSDDGTWCVVPLGAVHISSSDFASSFNGGVTLFCCLGFFVGDRQETLASKLKVDLVDAFGDVVGRLEVKVVDFEFPTVLRFLDTPKHATMPSKVSVRVSNTNVKNDS